MPGLPGRATPEGTLRFLERSLESKGISPGHFRTTALGLHLSSLGLGTYIGRPDGPTDLAVEAAVRTCLRSGRVNVLDTAINYRYQRAERSLGRALRGLLEAGAVRRDEVFVATKVGYFAPDGESPLSAEDWVEAELIRPGVLSPEDIVDGSHAMSPSYLRDQVGRSQRNLGLDTLDLVYLHNAADAQLPVVGREEFLRRLVEAFRTMESLRSEGAIESYGLATWEALRCDPADPGFLPLPELVGAAETAGGADHGLRFIQFPFSLAMTEAATRANQPSGAARRPLFRAADALRLGCFTSVPLVQGQLARRGPSMDGLSPAQSALQFARSAPGSLAALVGQKTPEHLSENLALAARPPWDESEFRRWLPAD